MTNIALLILVSFIINGCTREASQTTKIKIKFPEQTMSSQSISLKQSNITMANENSNWGLQAPISVGASNCFAVFARVPESASSTCVDSNGNTILNLNRISGMATAGAYLEIELPTGKGREIGVFAFKSSDGTCSNINEAIDTKNFSAPLAVGKTTADLVAGEMQIPITLSTSNAKSIEKCSGDPLVAWPIERGCTPKIAKMTSTGGGELAIEGNCLNPTTELEILNSVTNEKYPLSISSKTEKKISANLTSSLTMSAGVLYKLVLKTVHAQVQTPISLQIGAGFSVQSNGGKVGTFLTTTSMMYQSPGILMMANNGLPAGYFSKHYNDGAGTNIVAKKYYLYPSLYLFNNIFQNLSMQDLMNANVISANFSPVSSMYFSNSDCTGDILIYASSTDIIKGRYFVQPTSCDVNSPFLCTGQILRKITTEPVYQANFTYGSNLYFDAMMNSNILKCNPSGGSSSGLFVPASALADLDATDAPAIIENTNLSP